jgi:hypothetical protein
MSEVALPKDLLEQIREARQQIGAAAAADRQTLPFVAIADMQADIRRLCSWAKSIGELATRRRVPTNIDIADGGVDAHHPERTHITESGWKITVDPSIGGGGDLSFSYHENPPVVTSKGLLLTSKGLLYAFKSAKNIEFDNGTSAVINNDEGMVSNFGDGFGAYNLAPINPETFPLPQFLDTWENETGIAVIEHDLIVFARLHNLDQ